MSANILIIDDDKVLCTRLADYFNQYGLCLRLCHSGADGMAELARRLPDVVLLDVMLPDSDGFTLCRQIREKYQVPILMLTARGEVSDKVLGLELGAEDYLAKPFEPRELVARVQVLLRRRTSSEPADEIWQFGELTVDCQRHMASVSGSDIQLTGMEFKLLMLLAGSPGQVFSRDDVLNQLKGIDTDVFSRSIDILMSRLRQKLGDDPKQCRYIKTLRNVGYTFVAKRT